MHIEGFTDFVFEDGGIEHRVFRKGSGPAVIVMHELPGMSDQCIELAREVAARGFNVYLPLFFGKPGDNATFKFTLRLCINREFRLLAHRKSSPIVDWLRALCHHAHTECGGPGVGAIGMCLTGNFAISLMVDDVLMAPVASQPSLPLGIGKKYKRELAMSDDELARVKERTSAGAKVLGLRFTHDCTSPKERLDRLAEELGPGFERIDIDSSPGNEHGIRRKAHSVLTLDFVDQEGHPTHVARERVFAFLHESLVAE